MYIYIPINDLNHFRYQLANEQKTICQSTYKKYLIWRIRRLVLTMRTTKSCAKNVYSIFLSFFKEIKSCENIHKK